MSIERKHSWLQGTPVNIEDSADIPPNELMELLFDPNSKHAIIRNGHSSLLIPSDTLGAIQSLDPLIQADIIMKISAAIKDSSAVILIPTK